MASISSMPEQSDNDAPRPQLVISGDNDDEINTVAYLPDGRLVTGSGSGTVSVYLQNGEQGTSMEHVNGITSLVMTQDGAKIVSGDDGGEINVWDVESHQLVEAWSHQEGDTPIAISPNDRFIAAGSWTVGIFTMEGEQVNSIEVDHEVWSLSFSPDGNKLACGTREDICIYDVEIGTCVLGPLKGHESWINSVLWSRDGSRLFSASRDKTIRCWNTGTGEQTGQPWTGHTDCIWSVSLSPDGTLLASASADKTVRFWDTIHGRPVRQHLQHATSVLSVCFSPSGESVASGDEHGDVYLWRVPQVSSIHHLITPFMCIFGLIFIISQPISVFHDVRHSRFCSHTPLILCIAPPRVVSWNRTCNT